MAVMQHGIAFVSILCAMFHSTVHLPSNMLHVYNNHKFRVHSVYPSQFVYTRQESGDVRRAAALTTMQHPASCLADAGATVALTSTPAVRHPHQVPESIDSSQLRSTSAMQEGSIRSGPSDDGAIPSKFPSAQSGGGETSKKKPEEPQARDAQLSFDKPGARATGATVTCRPHTSSPASASGTLSSTSMLTTPSTTRSSSSSTATATTCSTGSPATWANVLTK
eukprot:1206248-Amphidinium_carterae.1